ncbi:MAG TPA: hypothetical protein VKY40_00410, partial [Halanaerobiales bacterium]|nr:hypothetical protein [Halanaerobiales bacterium]
AVELLLMDSPVNKFLKNGHNRQGDKESLPLYLPGNGALLLATGMMAAGWGGAENSSLAGFPDNQSWSVKYEGISCYL